MSWAGVPYKQKYMPLFSDDWNRVVDALNQLYFMGPYLHGADVIPTVDAKFDVGKPDRRWREIHALRAYFSESVRTEVVRTVYGYFSESAEAPRLSGVVAYFSDSVWIQGKRALKDWDPISIFYLYAEVQEAIRQKVEEAITNTVKPQIDQIEACAVSHLYNLDRLPTIEDYARSMDQKLDDIRALLGAAPLTLLGYVQGIDAYALSDVFPTDLTVEKTGAVRVKAKVDALAVLYLKWTPWRTGAPEEAALNAGDTLEPNSWYEFDFTVESGDKINVKVYPGTKLTLFVYNLPSA